MKSELPENGHGRLPRYPDWAAMVVMLLGFLARVWAASGTFLNPDEALHYRLANQVSLVQAYRQSLTASHPPLLTFVLYFWRMAGTSELWLRLPSVLAGVAFCWIFYKWLTRAASGLTGFIGLLFVALLPPVVLLSAEIRQYSLLLAFLAGALYFLDEAFAKNSAGRMAGSSVCLCLALLSHYSAFLFAAALGIYALLGIFQKRPPARLVWHWVLGQFIALALAIFLFKTHISKLGLGESRTPLQGWMSEFFLRRSYFDAAHDNPLKFLVGHTFGTFQYFFGQLAVGDVMALLFLVGVFLLLRGKGITEDRHPAPRLGIFLLMSYAAAAGASLAHVYPYGGTRHISFLIIPGIAGVSVGIAQMAGRKWARAVAAAALIVVACVAFGKPRKPWISRPDQSRTHMMNAMEFMGRNLDSSSIIFTDYESDLILGHYLCQQRPISLEYSGDFEEFHCDYHVVSASYRTATFAPENFATLWDLLLATHGIKRGTKVWIVQAGWDANLPEQLQAHFPEFRNLRWESFGNNIKILQLTAGQPVPHNSPAESH
jgi:hypothetical protein